MKGDWDICKEVRSSEFVLPGLEFIRCKYVQITYRLLLQLEWWNEDNRESPLDLLTVHLKPGGLEALRYSGVNGKLLVEDLEE